MEIDIFLLFKNDQKSNKLNIYIEPRLIFFSPETKIFFLFIREFSDIFSPNLIIKNIKSVYQKRVFWLNG